MQVTGREVVSRLLRNPQRAAVVAAHLVCDVRGRGLVQRRDAAHCDTTFGQSCKRSGEERRSVTLVAAQRNNDLRACTRSVTVCTTWRKQCGVGRGTAPLATGWRPPWRYACALHLSMACGRQLFAICGRASPREGARDVKICSQTRICVMPCPREPGRRPTSRRGPS